MPLFPKSSRLLKQVAGRLAFRQLLFQWFVLLIVFSATALVLLLVGRLSGIFPDWIRPWTVALVPALAWLVALLFPRRVTTSDAARLIDQHQRTDDLFLTLATLGTTAPEYAPLVVRNAEKAADHVDPRQLVRLQWRHPTLISAAVLGSLLLGAYFVPTLDPFGQVASARQVDEQRTRLEQSRKQTEARTAQLTHKDLDHEHSEEVQKAIEALKTALQLQKKGEPQQNLQQLNAQQKQIGEMYRKLNSGDLKSLFDKQGSQQLGQMHDQDQFRQWQQELQQGKSESLEDSLQKLQASTKQLSQEKKAEERTELERQLQKQLQELSDFAATKTGSKALNAALQRAMSQLEAARQNPQLSKEAMQDLMQSLELAQQELQSLAQSARDLEQIEEALKLINMAKQCKGNCSGEKGEFQGERTLQDYATLYAELLQQMGTQQAMQQTVQQGSSPGTKGAGEGTGAAKADEDPLKAEFVNEKAKSAIQKGKVLLSMKSKGQSDPAELKDSNYKVIIGEIRQSIDDVITQEEIPPGYVEGIKKYFDSLEKK
jgi:hypothetical protein